MKSPNFFAKWYIFFGSTLSNLLQRLGKLSYNNIFFILTKFLYKSKVDTHICREFMELILFPYHIIHPSKSGCTDFFCILVNAVFFGLTFLSSWNDFFAN